MIPQQEFFDTLDTNFEEEIGPSRNYRILYDQNKIGGFVDGIEAMKQAIYLLLSVERYDFSIYSFNAGVEFKNLIGKPVNYVASEVKRRIRDCLLQDDRIEEVDSFEVTINRSAVIVRYTAHTIFGDIEQEQEVLY